MQRKYIFIFINSLALLGSLSVKAQTDSGKLNLQDTAKIKMNTDAVFNRPFLSIGKFPLSLGGYCEANAIYSSTNGVGSNVSFQMRRMTLFVAGSIARHIRFLSELEFEDGAKEISLEYAAMDMELHPLFTLRGGIILNPIGAFNQNHDGPRWEIIDRPVSATKMLPATWSNAGFGFYGKRFSKNWGFSYEFYLTNGFNDKIINNDLGRTSLAAAKQNPERFEENETGILKTGRVALRNKQIGEIGFSAMQGAYNEFMKEGLKVDEKRNVSVIAMDWNLSIPALKTNIVGEIASVNVQLPNNYNQEYGKKQWGGFVDIVQPILRKPILGWSKAVLNGACRFEYVDWNVGKNRENGSNIFQDYRAIVPAISFRPVPGTVIRINYRYALTHDFFGNPPTQTTAWLIGFASYF
jgi:hypothetical protein